MCTVSFTIPYPPQKQRSAFFRRYGLNAYYTGKHWAQRKKDAEELHELTVLSMKRAKIRKEPLPFAVELRFRFNDRLDCSNHAIIVKIVEDAMKGWIIKDDSRRYVKSITTEFYNGDSIEVSITNAKS